MIIYNSLFYHIYELALRSKSNRDMPMFITILVISLCFMFNVFAILFLAEGFGLSGNYFQRRFRAIGALVFLGLISFYYLHNHRYKRFYDECSKRYRNRPSTLKAILVVVGYYIVSITLMLVAGMFKNKDWIFSSI